MQIANNGKVRVVRVGSSDDVVELNDRVKTLTDVFNFLGMSITSGETVWYKSSKIEASDFSSAVLDDGDEIMITGKKVGGSK